MTQTTAAQKTEAPAAPRRPDFPQRAEVESCETGENYTVVRAGKFADLGRYGVRHPLSGQTIPGKVFMKGLLDLTAMEISFGVLPPHASIPFLHRHKQNEEVYLFLSGEGQFQVDGAVTPVAEGTAVRVAPAGVRCCRNTSEAPMHYVVIQAKAGSLEQWTGTDGEGVPGTPEWPEAA
jgi:mannose-6-phosphate isomerase-like protein (cupin superfamily)